MASSTLVVGCEGLVVRRLQICQFFLHPGDGSMQSRAAESNYAVPSVSELPDSRDVAMKSHR